MSLEFPPMRWPVVVSWAGTRHLWTGAEMRRQLTITGGRYVRLDAPPAVERRGAHGEPRCPACGRELVLTQEGPLPG